MANHRTDTKGETLRVTLVKSPIGFNRNQAAVVRGLGLRRIRHTVELKDTPAARGMIHKVRHLVLVDQPKAQASGSGAPHDVGSKYAERNGAKASASGGGAPRE